MIIKLQVMLMFVSRSWKNRGLLYRQHHNYAVAEDDLSIHLVWARDQIEPLTILKLHDQFKTYRDDKWYIQIGVNLTDDEASYVVHQYKNENDHMITIT